MKLLAFRYRQANTPCGFVAVQYQINKKNRFIVIKPINHLKLRLAMKFHFIFYTMIIFNSFIGLSMESDISNNYRINLENLVTEEDLFKSVPKYSILKTMPLS